MKKWIFVLCIAMLISGKEFYAQQHVRIMEIDGPRKRIDELEKIKLLEVLNLDEKTMLQFFTRRKEFNENLMKLEDERDDKLDKIQDLIYNNASEQDFKKAISDVLNVDSRIIKAKEDFITSLDGLLTNEQRAKLILFDRNFKKEIRQIILKHRKEK